MFAEDGKLPEVLAPMTRNFREWLRPRLVDGRYFGFVIEDAGSVIAGIGLMLVDWPPHFLHPETDKRGYIMNVFVEPSHRGLGLAKEMMRRAEGEFESRGVIFLVLHASKMGRPVYEKLDWYVMPEMAKQI